MDHQGERGSKKGCAGNRQPTKVVGVTPTFMYVCWPKAWPVIAMTSKVVVERENGASRRGALEHMLCCLFTAKLQICVDFS